MNKQRVKFPQESGMTLPDKLNQRVYPGFRIRIWVMRKKHANTSFFAESLKSNPAIRE
jgi:hypothetical protein